VKLPSMAHFVILVSKQEKMVSSRDAHLRVKTSPLWQGRVARATERFQKIEAALITGDLRTLALTSWVEAWEMHSLFHTAQEPFSYFQASTIDALHFLAEHLKSDQPPIVTLDAGPNIHVIVPERARAEWKNILASRFPDLEILEDEEGSGAQVLRIEKS
jgi:diphosphomevalonate decarboxylase